MMLLVIVSVAIVLGGNNAVEDDFGFDTELYFGMTILRGWPIESILPLEPELTGYSFSHWSSTPNGRAFDFSTPILYEMTFYAIWAEGGSTVNYGLDEAHYEREVEVYSHDEAYDYASAYDYYPMDDYNMYYGDAPTYDGNMYYGDAPMYYETHEYDEAYGEDDTYNAEINDGFEFDEEDKIFVRFTWNHEYNAYYDEALAAVGGHIGAAPVKMAETPQVEMFGGNIPIMPFNVTVSSVAQLRQQIINRTGNNTQWTIYLNWGTVVSTPADIAITIPANTNINLQSASAARPIWHQQLTGNRHFYVSGTLTIGNIQLSRVSQDTSVIGGGIEVNNGGNLYINHGGALIQNNHAESGGGISVLPGGRATIRGGTIAGNIASGINMNSGGGIRVAASLPLGNNPILMAYLTFTREYPTFVNDNHQISNDGGGVISTHSATITISGNQPLYITNNTAAGSGGGLTVSGPLHISGSGPLNIRDNTATSYGGGMVISGPSGQRGFVYISPVTPIDISHNTSTNAHGGGLLISRGWTELDENINTIRLGANVTITNNSAGSDGAGIMNFSGSIELNNTTITDNTAAINGGGIYTSGSNGRIVSNGATIHSNMASVAVGVPTMAGTGGGGVSVSNGIFTMNSGTIGYPDATAINAFSNRAIRGAGVRVSQNGIFNFNGGSILYNVTTNVEDGTTALADGRGGGVFITDSGNFNMSGVAATERLVRNNAADLGGGVYIRGGNLRIENENAHIQANTVTTGASGAGVHQSGGVVTMSAGSIRNHNAEGTANGLGLSYGSGVDMRSGTFYMSGGAITSNRTGVANMPGGVNVEGGSIFNMTGTSTIGGSAENMWNQGTTGGGVRVATTDGFVIPGVINLPGGSFNMENGIGESGTRAISHNRATVSGGGVHIVMGEFNMRGTAGTSIVSHNQVTGEAATNGGGGVFIESGNFRMENTAVSVVEANIVNNANVGAGVHQTGGTVTMSGANTHIRNHNQQGTAAGMGPSHGSGVDMRGGVFNMSAGYITSNRTNAADRPGGVNVEGAGVFNMAGTSTIGGSVANMNLGTTGGGVRVAGTGAFNMEGADGTRTISHNQATVSGGGAHIAGGQFNMQGTGGTSTINNNEVTGTAATSGGGGVFLGAGDFRMQNTAVSAVEANIVNNASVGAGLHQTGGIVTMSGANAHIRNHNAQGTAAGMGLSHGSGVDIRGGIFNMSAGFITSNRTGTLNFPGGVNIDGAGSAFNMSGGTVGGTTASNLWNQGTHGGGIRVANSATFNMTAASASITGNRATQGGGVHVSNNADFVMGNGTISGNLANSTVNGAGGGVFLSGTGSFEMTGGTIGGSAATEANRAVYGGGIHVAGGAVAELSNSQITGNMADEDGGGIWVSLTSSLIANNVAITGNEAEEMGGGIFTENYEYTFDLNMLAVPAPYSNLTIQGVTFFGNTANQDWPPPNNALATGIPGGSQSVRNHPINNYDINFEIDGIPLRFTKTDNIIAPETGNPLSGAVFQLYSWDTVGDEWIASGSQVTSDINGVVTLKLSTTAQYRLVEVAPPNGFMPVFGYWLISLDDSTLVATITHHNTNPHFYYYDGNWYVGNMLDFELPLAGGFGRSRFFFAGSAFIFMGLGVAVYGVLASKINRRESRVRYR